MSYSRRHFLKTTGAIAGFALAGCGSGPEQTKPNVIFVTSDTTRYDRMGFNGYAVNNTTPFLNQLAEEGLVFSKCYAQSTCTFPSVSSFMTSKHPTTLRVLGNLSPKDYIRSRFTTLAEAMKSLGYTTIGASSVLWLGPRTNISDGFDYFSFERHGKGCTRDGRKTLERMKELVEEADQKEGVFLWLHLFEPHNPYLKGNVFGRRKEHASTGHAWNNVVCGSDAQPWVSARPDRVFMCNKRDRYIDQEVLDELNQRYDTEVHCMDAIVHDLIAFLKAQGVYDEARGDIFIFNADHGELMGEHGFCSRHGDTWTEVIHTPLLIKSATLSKGKAIDGLVGNIDIMPTVLDLVSPGEYPRLSQELGLEGTSMLPLIREGRKTRDYVITDDPRLLELCCNDGRHIARLRRKRPDVELDPNAVYDNASPSGHVEFTQENCGNFSVNLPGVDLSEHQGKKYELKLRPKGAADTHTTRFKGTLGEDGLEFVLANSTTEWDDQFKWGAREWKLTLRDAGDAVVYDSEEELGTWIQFWGKPSFNHQELYDLENDPREQNNMVRENKDTFDRLARIALTEHEKHTGRPFSRNRRGPAKKPEEAAGFSEEEKQELGELGYL